MLLNTNNGATFPGLTLKAWAHVSGAGALIKGFNIASITKGGAGIYTLNFTNNLASTTYLAKCHVVGGSTSNDTGRYALTSLLAASLSYTHYNNAGAGGDTANPHYIEVWE